MRILLVEDDKDLQRLLKKALSEAGYVVDAAVDGEEGHFLGDTGTFSNTIYTAYPVSTAGGSVTPFIESDPILGDIDMHFSGNFVDEDSILFIARQQGFSTAAIGKLGPTLMFDHTERTGEDCHDPGWGDLAHHVKHVFGNENVAGRIHGNTAGLRFTIDSAIPADANLATIRNRCNRAVRSYLTDFVVVCVSDIKVAC